MFLATYQAAHIRKIILEMLALSRLASPSNSFLLYIKFG